MPALPNEGHERYRLPAQLRIARLKGPRDECSEPARLILKAPYPIKVLDNVFGFLNSAEHHRCSRPHAEAVYLFHHFQPHLRLNLPWTQDLPHPVGKNLGTPAGNGIKTCLFQDLHGLPDGKVMLIGKVRQLRGRESMDVYVVSVFYGLQ